MESRAEWEEKESRYILYDLITTVARGDCGVWLNASHAQILSHSHGEKNLPSNFSPRL